MFCRLKVIIHGVVQGVGFRPFIYRLASEYNFKGWVMNSSEGVFMEIEGEKEKLNEFLLRIEKEKPPRSYIQSLEYSFLDLVGYNKFEIRDSDKSGRKTTLILPDIATCNECLSDIFSPNNRRYLYPFTNCTNCGPRFSIIESLPYDRPNTTMKNFVMCKDCQNEYENPEDRRFHAQPNACPQCGPHLELWDKNGNVIKKYHDAIVKSVEAIKNGKIVAIKGLGGFHLMVDARNDEAIKRLRLLKNREEKPFALMYPNVTLIKEHCYVSPLEERLLSSPEAPIVLLKHQNFNTQHSISKHVAPNNPYLGIMLPYTPLHHILMKELQFPVIATSGNISDEPICIDEYEALKRLHNIGDLFLIHNRPIVRHIDDSIARIVEDKEMIIRRARGYAPLPISLKKELPSVLAVGGHLKNTIAVSKGNNIFISQHIGDLETELSYNAFQRVIKSLCNVYEINPEAVICDLHPNYFSTQFAKGYGLPITYVQHHYAHILSCVAENEIELPCLGISWDGTGYGLDATIWGGEFLFINHRSFSRVSHFKQFHLPGGDKAIREPRRVAFAILFEIFGDNIFEMKDLETIKSFTQKELDTLKTMLKKNINSPLTSSAGRLFDAVSSIIGIRQITKYEGQAAMELEFSIDNIKTEEIYPFKIYQKGNIYIIDWSPMILNIIEDKKRNMLVGEISAKFHNTLSEIIVDIVKRINQERVVLSGGCFQNKYLTEKTIDKLKNKNFKVYWHQRIPPNDGGIALGQIMAYFFSENKV